MHRADAGLLTQSTRFPGLGSDRRPMIGTMATPSVPRQQPASRKKLLFVWKPPKRISEMTEEELDAMAQAIAERVREKVER